MATVEHRYNAATEYIRRAIREVERGGVYSWSSIVPAVFATEVYAGQLKTENVKNELKRIEERWLRAGGEIERARIAREAELLADRTAESLPGAPTDWKRTNLGKYEPPRVTPATSYAREVEDQAHAAWTWAEDAATSATSGASTAAHLLLLGGALLLGIKAVDYFRGRETRNSTRGGSGKYSVRLTSGEVEALRFLRGRYTSAKEFLDGLIPLDDSADRALGLEFDRGNGPYRFQILATDVRKTLRATAADGGDYGAIPNLRSDAVEWVLGQEWER